MSPRVELHSVVAFCSVVEALLSRFSTVNADSSLTASFEILPWSVPSPPPPSIYPTLAWIAAFVVAGAVAAAWYLKRRRKLIVAVASTLLVVIAIASLVWYTRASIYYSFDTLYTYPRTGDNYFTLRSQNTGYVQGSFSLLVRLTNASFSAKTNYTYELINDLTAKFDYTLQPKEQEYTDVYFIIADNVVGFSISLAYQSSSDFLVTSNSLGDTYLSFAKAPFEDNFTSQRIPPPP